MGEGATRRPSSWAIVELTRAGERKAEEGVLAPLLREAFALQPNHPVFIPSKAYTTGGRRVTVHLMEGYAFVGSDGHDLSIPSRTEQPYVRRLLMTNAQGGRRAISVVPDATVRQMEDELSKHVGDDVRLGSQVVVNNGTYARMGGEVLGTTSTGDLVVRFQMRSLDLIAEVPRSFAVPSDGGDGDV